MFQSGRGEAAPRPYPVAVGHTAGPSAKRQPVNWRAALEREGPRTSRTQVRATEAVGVVSTRGAEAYGAAPAPGLVNTNKVRPLIS